MQHIISFKCFLSDIYKKKINLRLYIYSFYLIYQNQSLKYTNKSKNYKIKCLYLATLLSQDIINLICISKYYQIKSYIL
jgi:hypothetical protein